MFRRSAVFGQCGSRPVGRANLRWSWMRSESTQAGITCIGNIRSVSVRYPSQRRHWPGGNSRRQKPLHKAKHEGRLRSWPQRSILDSLFLVRYRTLEGSSQGPWLLSAMRTPVALPPTQTGSSAMQRQRHRFKPILSLEERLAQEAKRLRDEAKILPPGRLRDEAVRRARQAETGSHISEWLLSPGLRAPT